MPLNKTNKKKKRKKKKTGKEISRCERGSVKYSMIKITESEFCVPMK